MTKPIQAGDKVRSMCMNEFTRSVGTAVEVPEMEGKFVAVFTDYWGEPVPIVFDANGVACYSPVVERIDPVITAWEELPDELKVIIAAAGQTKKISCIKYVRGLCNLSLSDAKTLVERAVSGELLR